MTNLAVNQEIAWLRGFGWAPADIAAKLAVPVMYVLTKLQEQYAPDEQEMFDIASAARREARLVYGRPVKQWRANG